MAQETVPDVWLQHGTSMTLARITELRALARKHEKTNRSAKIILECLEEIERLQELYSICLDVAYKSGRLKQIAKNKLRRLAEGIGN